VGGTTEQQQLAASAAHTTARHGCQLLHLHHHHHHHRRCMLGAISYSLRTSTKDCVVPHPTNIIPLNLVLLNKASNNHAPLSSIAPG
jgi:hypothetical protein